MHTSTRPQTPEEQQLLRELIEVYERPPRPPGALDGVHAAGCALVLSTPLACWLSWGIVAPTAMLLAATLGIWRRKVLREGIAAQAEHYRSRAIRLRADLESGLVAVYSGPVNHAVIVYVPGEPVATYYLLDELTALGCGGVHTSTGRDLHPRQHIRLEWFPSWGRASVAEFDGEPLQPVGYLKDFIEPHGFYGDCEPAEFVDLVRADQQVMLARIQPGMPPEDD